jgi:hypothetical protein
MCVLYYCIVVVVVDDSLCIQVIGELQFPSTTPPTQKKLPLSYSAVVHSSVVLVESIQLGGYSSTMLPWRSFPLQLVQEEEEEERWGEGGVILSNSSKSKFLLLLFGIVCCDVCKSKCRRDTSPNACPLHPNMTVVPRKYTTPPSFLKKEEEKKKFLFKLLFYMIFL